ncbi:MAG: fumarate hydratase [Spirochaetes bacterium]|nr:fumarate hydratase [Spirochaetota bacterium]
MRAVSTKVVENAIYEALISATYKIPEDIKKALKSAHDKENTPLAKHILNEIIKNYELALQERAPLCQDTGTILLFIEMGQDILFSDGFLLSSLNRAISRTTLEGYLRASTVNDPLRRNNNNTNTPPIIHLEMVRGDRVKIYIMLKGAGAENVSCLKMLSPSMEIEFIKEEIVQWIKENAAKACPPVVVGIGLGGNYESAPILAKKALLRKIGSSNKNDFYARMEKDLLNSINKLGIGPMGVGGKTTALSVQVETYPTHIASLPLAINLNCHSTRISKIVI